MIRLNPDLPNQCHPPGAENKQQSNSFCLLALPSQPSVWPGEPVLMVLDDLEFQWKRGRLPNLLPAVELLMLAVLNADSSVQVWMSHQQPDTHTR